jgi:predicted DNA-binding transcriptional regulator AlpA
VLASELGSGSPLPKTDRRNPAMPNASLIPSVLINAAELAQILSVSKPTIWRMKEALKLPKEIALTSQCIRWRRADIDSWLAAGCPTQEGK